MLGVGDLAAGIREHKSGSWLIASVVIERMMQMCPPPNRCVE
jgi:hypothetical protein